MRFLVTAKPCETDARKGATKPFDAALFSAYTKHNEEMAKAGVLLALDGLHPPSAGARVTFETGRPRVTDGPFPEAKEVLGGYWMIQVRSKAEALGGAVGPCALQAAIAACHGRALTAEANDWPRIASLHAALAAVAPSPVVEPNRAVAVSMAFGAEAALPIVDTLLEAPAVKGHHLLPAVRGDLLAKVGRRDEARAERERAAALTRNETGRALLLAKAAGVSARGGGSGS